MTQRIATRTHFRRPLAAIGASLVVAGAVLFLVLTLIDLTAATENPYRSLATFIIVPTVVLSGMALFAISVYLQYRRARRRGEDVRFNFSFDTSDPKYVKNLWLFMGASAVLIIALIYVGTKAYEATESVGFCGEACHEVMEPQNITYQNSPHARVACVECHIGPGASFWVKAKFDGIRQLFATARNTYSRPIETPVSDLRPAQETCEGCHWPKQFYGDKLITRTYYRTDEDNSPWTIKLMMKIGGGNPRTGQLEGIHWHMIGTDIVEYFATDHKRENIPWIRQIKANGDTIIFKDPDQEMPDLSDPLTEIRRFDCMDCHNRPSHLFQAPANAINLALSTRRMSPELPYIRQIGLDLLNADYPDRDSAIAAMTYGLVQYYKDNYPEVIKNRQEEVEQALEVLKTIYNLNFFPEMRTDYRDRQNNLSHFVNDGCFRCHDGVKADKYGNTISNDCETCHLIIAQGPTENVDELESDIGGLPFKHPEDIDGAWQEMKCTECHDSESGY